MGPEDQSYFHSRFFNNQNDELNPFNYLDRQIFIYTRSNSIPLFGTTPSVSDSTGFSINVNIITFINSDILTYYLYNYCISK